MSPGPDDSDPESPDAEPADPGALTPEEREARRRRLAEVFGETLPEQTSDDVADPQSPNVGEDWLRRQVPPHHG